MNKTFIKSMTAAIAGLGLVSSCSMLHLGKDSHKCASGKCSSKKMEDSHKCGAANGCAAAKPAEVAKTDVKADAKAPVKAEAAKPEAKKEKKHNKKAKKAEEKKEEAKTENKAN